MLCAPSQRDSGCFLGGAKGLMPRACQGGLPARMQTDEAATEGSCCLLPLLRQPWLQAAPCCMQAGRAGRQSQRGTCIQTTQSRTRLAILGSMCLGSNYTPKAAAGVHLMQHEAAACT